jgi:hypothetical protein
MGHRYPFGVPCNWHTPEITSGTTISPEGSAYRPDEGEEEAPMPKWKRSAKAGKRAAVNAGKPTTANKQKRVLTGALSPLSEGINDDGKSFVELLESRKANKGSDMALSLVEHFSFVSLVKGGRIFLRSWAPTEKNSKPNLMVRFSDKGKSSSSDGLCNIFTTGKLNITMASIKARAPKAAKALVKAGVHANSDQRSYDATPALVAALTAAAMEWATDMRLKP